jgi:hypothetical protein
VLAWQPCHHGLSSEALGQWLCVLSFRRVCYLQAAYRVNRQDSGAIRIPPPVVVLTVSSESLIVYF